MIETLEDQAPLSNQFVCIRVNFGLSGKQLPADHGYLVYSGISKSCSSLHGIDWLGVELINGFPSGRGLITLPEHGATLRLRIPADHYRDVMLLAGKPLNIGGHQIRLGLPSVHARVVTIKKFTEPEPFLEAVNRKLDQSGIKGHVELARDVEQTVSLPRDRVAQTVSSRSVYNSNLYNTSSTPSNPSSKLETQNSKLEHRFRRRIVTIHGKSVVGFSVAVHDLNDEDSILLQAGAVEVVSSDDGARQWQSIFSRRAMGCGNFQSD